MYVSIVNHAWLAGLVINMTMCLATTLLECSSERYRNFFQYYDIMTIVISSFQMTKHAEQTS